MAQEEYQIDAAEKSNVKIQETIASLETRKKLWYEQRDKDVIKLDSAIAELEQVDIDSEISAHKLLEQWNENSTAMQRYKREMLTLEQALERNSKQVAKIDSDLEYAKEAKCPTCEQELHDDKHKALLEELQHQHDDAKKYQEQVTYDISKVQKKIDNIGDVVMKPDTYYDSAEQAYNHKSTMAHLKQQLEDKGQQEVDQEQGTVQGQVVDYSASQTSSTSSIDLTDQIRSELSDPNRTAQNPARTPPSPQPTDKESRQNPASLKNMT